MKKALPALLLLLAVSCTVPPAPTGTPGPAPVLPPEQARGCMLPPVPWFQAKDNIGAFTTVCGPVVGVHYYRDSDGKPTLLDLGNPDSETDRVIVLIWGQSRGNFPEPPEQFYAGKTICVYGLIAKYNGTPLIRVDTPDQIE